jgi:hypothetical protein
MLCKCLLPGKELFFNGNHSLNFHFSNYIEKKFYLIEYHIVISNKNEFHLIKNNIQNFINQLQLNILAVQHARHILSTEELSYEEKSDLIKKNISSLIEENGLEKNIYDQTQKFLIKISAEKNLSQIKENLNRLMHKHPKTFDKDIYEAINHTSAVFKDHFTISRNSLFVSRLISYHYLFNKIIKQKKINTPNVRHLNVKLLKINISHKRMIIGVLVTITLLQEGERFEQTHLMQSLKNCIQNIKYIKNSFVSDKRDQDIISCYMEIEKQNNSNFSLEEIKKINKKLPIEIQAKIENIIHPIFMPRNEEEVLRNIILLSKQIKYVKDIPQVIISYDKQTGKDIFFTIILVRLLKTSSSPLKEYFSYSQTFLKYTPEEVKIIGSLKNKYQKEVNLFKISLNKTPFYRKDYSLDLQKARQIVVSELVKVIGDFRDYNGGMIHKQTQTLDQLKHELPYLEKDKEFLIENFFYSIHPGIMQSILDSHTLKTFFLLFLQIIEQDFIHKNFIIKKLSMPKYILIMVASHTLSFKDKIQSEINKLKIPSFDLTSCFIQENGISTLGYIYRTSDLSKHSFFYNTILNIMKKNKLEI